VRNVRCASPAGETLLLDVKRSLFTKNERRSITPSSYAVGVVLRFCAFIELSMSRIQAMIPLFIPRISHYYPIIRIHSPFFIHCTCHTSIS
jgi:hypothetical protein